MEGIGGDKIPTSLDFDVVDEWMTVSDADAFRTARRLTREEGIFIGGSGGLNVFSRARGGAPARRPRRPSW